MCQSERCYGFSNIRFSSSVTVYFSVKIPLNILLCNFVIEKGIAINVIILLLGKIGQLMEVRLNLNKSIVGLLMVPVNRK